MNVDKLNEMITGQEGLSKTLGMEFISTPEEDTCMARMKVDDRNKQPFGFLSGGASLALAENLAGVASMAICPNKICVGINVSGNHVKAVEEGSWVTAHAKLVSRGHKLHVWHIEIMDEDDDVISSVEVTNYVITPKK
ncbi:MAG: PaaI family thioesterase [Prevotella sp.]|jgi:uncharacterized protein (TIGR00369 family)|nr:PaaI family thioesterase [Prevotella sp.]